MTSSAAERTKRMIHTAGCIIIGDEVLGGKVVMVFVSGRIYLLKVSSFARQLIRIPHTLLDSASPWA